MAGNAYFFACITDRNWNLTQPRPACVGKVVAERHLEASSDELGGLNSEPVGHASD
jgi:hypothetical protein